MAQLTAKEKAVLAKLLEQGEDDLDDDEEAEQAPRGRRRKPAVRSSAAGASDGDVFVLRGESAKTFLSSLGVAASEAGEEIEEEAEEETGEEAEGGKPEPRPAGRSRYFRN